MILLIYFSNEDGVMMEFDILEDVDIVDNDIFMLEDNTGEFIGSFRTYSVSFTIL